MSTASHHHGHRSSDSRSRDVRRMRREALLADFFAPPVQSTRYRVEKVIGEGAYGVVTSAIDSQSGARVAVKRIKKVLHSDGMATRILRELKFLRLLNAHDNVVSVKDVLIPDEREAFNDVFVVMELMPTDLGRLLRSKTVLSQEHIKLLMFQLLCGVNFLHASHVFHRDLNPANILVNTDCQLRICDFGLARLKFQNTGKGDDDYMFWTDYVATRWYRAPELILAQANTEYSTAIDMWSVGCIFAEMLSKGRPLFPGKNGHEQLSLILSVTGKPSDDVITRIGDRRLAAYLRTLPNDTQRVQLETLFATPPDTKALDLLARLLTFDPGERVTAADALALPYFDELRHHGFGAPAAPLDERQFAFERYRLTAQQMRFEFLKEIVEYHPEARDELLASFPLLAGSNNSNNPHGSLNSGIPPQHPNAARRGRYTVPSQAARFARDMKESEKVNNPRKIRTLSSDIFAEINPDDTPATQVPADMDYRFSTMGEAELSRIGDAPKQHASSFATHAATLGTDAQGNPVAGSSSGSGNSAMEE